jgi:hypothetical protein
VRCLNHKLLPCARLNFYDLQPRSHTEISGRLLAWRVHCVTRHYLYVGAIHIAVEHKWPIIRTGQTWAIYNILEHTHSWEGSTWPGHEIPHLLWGKVHYRVHKSLPLFPIRSHIIPCEIWGPNGNDCEEYCLLGYDAVQWGKCLLTFRKNVIPHLQGGRLPWRRSQHILLKRQSLCSSLNQRRFPETSGNTTRFYCATLQNRAIFKWIQFKYPGIKSKYLKFRTKKFNRNQWVATSG